MSDRDEKDIVARRFECYRATYETGRSINLMALEAGLSALERERFSSLVDAFLEHAPRRPFDADAFEHSRVAELVERSVRRAADARHED